MKNYLKGTTEQRPANKYLDNGICFWDLTLSHPIWWNGTNWVTSDNEVASIAKSGSFLSKPTPTNIGFQYFNTDTHKMITWDGTKWWNPDGTEATS